MIEKSSAPSYKIVFENDLDDISPRQKLASQALDMLCSSRAMRLTYEQIESAMEASGLDPYANPQTYQWLLDQLESRQVIVVEELEEPIPTAALIEANARADADEVEAILAEIAQDSADVTADLLTASEERRLLEIYADGRKATEAMASAISHDHAEQLSRRIRASQSALTELIERNRRLVCHVVSRYVQGARHLDWDDLVQEGLIGLFKAIEKFDLDSGGRLSTYAVWWIRQHVQRAIADQDRLIRFPVHCVEAINRLRVAEQQLEQELNRVPTEEEIAFQLDPLSPNEKQEIYRLRELDAVLPVHLKTSLDRAIHTVRRLRQLAAMNPVSIDLPLDEAEAVCLGDYIPDKRFPLPFEAVVQQTMVEDVGAVVDGLNQREAKVITLRFGLGDGVRLTLEEIGQQFSVTRERVRQIEAKALRKLRHPLRSRKLRAYLES